MKSDRSKRFPPHFSNEPGPADAKYVNPNRNMFNKVTYYAHDNCMRVSKEAFQKRILNLCCPVTFLLYILLLTYFCVVVLLLLVQ